MNEEQFNILVTLIKETKEELKADIAELNKKYEGLNEKYEGLNEKYEGLRTDIAELNKKYEGLNEKYEGLRTDIAELNKKYEGLNEKYEGLRTDVSGLNEKYNTLRENMFKQHIELTKLITDKSEISIRMCQEIMKIGETRYQEIKNTLEELRSDVNIIHTANRHDHQEYNKILKRNNIY